MNADNKRKEPPPPPADAADGTVASANSSNNKRGRVEEDDDNERKKDSHTVNVVILGCSFGGLGAALRLLERKQQQQVVPPLRIMVVDPKPYFTIGGTWQFAWTNRASVVQTWELKDAPCIKEKQIELVSKAATRIDTTTSTIHLESAAVLKFDHLIIATGIHGDASSIPGMDALLDIHNMHHVDRQRQELADFVEKAKQKSIDERDDTTNDNDNNNDKDKLVFVVVTSEKRYKCPLGPFEQAFLVDQVLRDANVRHVVDIIITYSDEWPMPLVTREPFVKEMKSRDIQFYPYFKIASVDCSSSSSSKNECVYENGKRIRFDMAWSLYPAQASDFLLSFCNNNKEARGLIPVDAATNRILLSSSDNSNDDSPTTTSSYSNLYAVGDVCWANTGGRDLQPKAGEFAYQMGRRAADCIMNSLQEEKSDEASSSKNHLFIEEGRRGGCFAEAGWDKNLKVNSDFSQVVSGESTDPRVWVEEVTDDAHAKSDWVNQYITQIFGPDAPLFTGGGDVTPAVTAEPQKGKEMDEKEKAA